MAETIVQVNSGSGPKLHGWDRSIGANTVIDQLVIPGEFPYASYYVGSTASIATSADHLLQIMAGSSLNVRLRKIHVEQSANATTAGIIALTVLRLTTAGTGGTALTPSKMDSGDVAAGATAMTLPTAKGTEGVEIGRTVLSLRQAVGTTTSQVDDVFEWVQHPGMKPIIIPAGASNGICIKIGTGVAAASCAVWVEFVETAFL